MFLYPTFFSPFCYISPLCTIFKTPGSFASVWTIFPAPSWHREKCHCTTYGTYGTNVSMERRSTQTWLRVAWFALGFLQWKKHAQQPFSKPHCFVNVKHFIGVSLIWLWWILSTFTCHFVHFIRLWSRLFWLQIWTSTWTCLNPFIQSTIPHNQNTFLTNGHPTW